jgi:hypothetical protein
VLCGVLYFVQRARALALTRDDAAFSALEENNALDDDDPPLKH